MCFRRVHRRACGGGRSQFELDAFLGLLYLRTLPLRLDLSFSVRDSSSLTSNDTVPAAASIISPSGTSMRGTLVNYNTIESFKSSDKTALLKDLGGQIWAHMSTGAKATTSGPVTWSDLNPFIMLTFADLKKYKYYYWCGFPALLQKPGWETVLDRPDEEWSAIDQNIVSLAAE